MIVWTVSDIIGLILLGIITVLVIIWVLFIWISTKYSSYIKKRDERLWKKYNDKEEEDGKV
jgi:hypothetical protein